MTDPRANPAIHEYAVDDRDGLATTWPVMAQLRPHLADAATYVDAVQDQMRREGFRLAAARDADGTPRALAGFRLHTMLARGRSLYVDDLVTDAAVRSRGYGDALFDWLLDQARAWDCAELHLDSGVQRFDAHRFYLRRRMAISAHHFSIRVGRS